MSTPRVLILSPVYNDWAAASMLLDDLNQVLKSTGYTADVLLVDDGSTDPPMVNAIGRKGLGTIEILRLRRNLGHQRAIAIGLAWVHANRPCDLLVVMDCDGEDSAVDVPRLLQAAGEPGHERIVFAERTRRSESLLFQLFYRLYCLLHLLLTGIRVRVGNFSAMPRVSLERLTVVSELWNHYAAAVFKSRIPYTSLPTTRGRRYAGESRMNFVALVTHGLSAISVFAEIVGVRILVAAGALSAGAIALLGAAPFLDAGRHAGEWTILAAAVLLLAPITIGLGLLLPILSHRQFAAFLPSRDHHHFVWKCESVTDKS